MEIEQYLYDLTESGEAIVAYKMISEAGAALEVCNLGASVLSLTLPIDGELRNVITGHIARGMKGIVASDMVGGIPFEERLWEGRVEGNRVVMALSYDDNGATVHCEVVFDFDDDHSFEVTYQGYVEGSAELDLCHLLTFDLDGEMMLGGALLEPRDEVEGLYDIITAQPNILNFAATLSSSESDNAIEIITSQPNIYCNDGIFATLNASKRIVNDQERYIQKLVCRTTKYDVGL